MTWIRNTPWWVWLICVFFALLQPATHLSILTCAPKDVEPVGLQKPDSVIYIHAMRMFETGFYSPYATCKSPVSDHSFRLYAIPFYLLYAIAGAVARMVHIGDFMALGWANGLCGGLYLLAAYHFMRAVLIARANVAFVLFAFAGGLGGVLFVASAILGVTHDEFFGKWFYRFAIYDLVEGTNLAPYLLMPRLYYTLPMSIGFCGVTTYITAIQMKCRAHAGYAWLMLFTGAFLNARVGVALFGIFALYLSQHSARPLRATVTAALPIVAGVGCAAMYMMATPAFVSNYASIVRQGMWSLSYVSASLPLLLLAGPVVSRDVKAFPLGYRLLCRGVIGFLAAFTFLYVVYQIYFGALITGTDHAAAVQVSDIALAGGVAGILVAMRTPRATELPEHAWVIVWALLFTALALGAFGKGWTLRFSPQRLMPFLGIPLALLAAESLARIRVSNRIFSRAALAGSVLCGAISIAVSSLVFQGPLGMQPGLASGLGMNVAYVPKSDAKCLASLIAGVVMAPPPYNDTLSLREGVKTVGGFGAAGLSDQGSALLDADVRRLFLAGTDASERERILRAWCVQFVFLPAEQEEGIRLRSEFDALPQLHAVAESGGARLYAVR